MRIVLDWLALVALCGFNFWLSAQETLSVPSVLLNQDKLEHAGFYFIMGVLAWRAFRHFAWSNTSLIIVSIIYCSLYGISDEWHQSLVPGRQSSIADWIADTLGATLAMYAVQRFKAHAIKLSGH